jgi:hypothetical protein
MSIPDPGSEFSIPDPGPKRSRIRIRIKELKYFFNPENCFKAIGKIIWDSYPDSRFLMHP